MMLYELACSKGVTMRCVAIVFVIGVVVSSPTRADTTLQWSETLYDKTGNHSYKAQQYFILHDGSVFRQATLRLG
jgi:hypothetical protein